MKKIGVLALQGDFIEHISILHDLGVIPQEVRVPRQIPLLDGLIIPGGESTSIGKLAREFDLIKPIQEMIRMGKPVWGTCAGMILLANTVYENESSKKKSTQPTIGGMDITVVRNAFGRQVDSFEQPIMIEGIKNAKNPFHAVFIRAPIIQKVKKSVTILAKLSNERIVAAQQKNILVTSFHPELTNDARIHEYFLSLI